MVNTQTTDIKRRSTYFIIHILSVESISLNTFTLIQQFGDFTYNTTHFQLYSEIVI